MNKPKSRPSIDGILSTWSLSRAWLVCLMLLALLFPVELFFSHLTRSLLIFCIALFHITLFVFFLIIGISRKIFKKEEKARFRSVATLLMGLLLVLSSGHVFHEIYCRFQEPKIIDTSVALMVISIAVVGNLFLFQLAFKIPTLNIFQKKIILTKVNYLFNSIWWVMVFIYFTDYLFLDTLFSVIIGGSIFLFTGFKTMDAYWTITEIA